MLLIPLTFLMIASLFHLFKVSSFPTKLTATGDTKELFPVPGLTFHALGGSKVQATSGAQDDSTPKLDMDRRNMKKHLSEQMPTRVRDHR